jgi:GT2 family glycosyltransferase
MAQLPEIARDERFTFVQQRGRGLPGALNTGMRAAETEFAAILFGDDMWDLSAVEVARRYIVDHPHADFFHSARRVIDDAGNPISSVHQARSDVSPEAFAAGSPVKHLLCWRVELALAIGGIDESLNSVGADDYDFPWSMLEAGARFVPVPDCLYVYRDHRSTHRLTTHIPLRTHLRETRRILEKHGVPETVIASRLERARQTYLRQCLYSSRLDAWLKRGLRHDPATGWRDSYH